MGTIMPHQQQRAVIVHAGITLVVPFKLGQMLGSRPGCAVVGTDDTEDNRRHDSIGLEGNSGKVEMNGVGIKTHGHRVTDIVIDPGNSGGIDDQFHRAPGRRRCGNDHAVRSAVERAVVDDQLNDIIASEIGGEGRRRHSGIRKHGRAADRNTCQTPGITQGIAVGITAGAAVEGYQAAGGDVLVRPGVGNRCAVGRGGSHRHAARGAVDAAVVDDQLNDVVSIEYRR